MSASAYLDGIANGVVRFQHCESCGAAQTLSRFACARCGSEGLVWRDAVGGGTVYAVTVVTRAPTDVFRALVPYTLVLVDLDEGVRVMAHGATGLRIGDSVHAGTLAFGDSALLYFRKPQPPQLPQPPQPDH